MRSPRAAPPSSAIPAHPGLKRFGPGRRVGRLSLQLDRRSEEKHGVERSRRAPRADCKVRPTDCKAAEGSSGGKLPSAERKACGASGKADAKVTIAHGPIQLRQPRSGRGQGLRGGHQRDLELLTEHRLGQPDNRG